MLPPLPIDGLLPELRAALDQHGVVVLEAPPGSGKTTRVPPALAREDGQVWVLEPRRIAARASAARVAEEQRLAGGDGRVGGFVGYAVRFDRKEGPDTRVLYVTEALLGRRIAADPWLRGGPRPVDVVVLDEFHERSIHTDTALALLVGLRQERPDLRLVVMSATFDAERLARWLGAPRLSAPGRPHPVEIEYLPRPDERPPDVLAAAAVRATLARPPSTPGRAVLVFLPGVGEIERTAGLLGGLVDHEGRPVPVLPLHGELEGGAQDAALRPDPQGRARVVLATNVAETSVTVADVGVVIDTGLARQAGHDPWTGLGTLERVEISRASADQRAGRAGRTGPGRCLRLYTRAQHEARPAETLPELRRLDLAGLRLDLATRRRRPGEAVAPPWFEAPPEAAWRAAGELLRRLGALDAADTPTPMGEAMAALPLAPRLARVAIEAAGLGAVEDGAALVARLGDRGRRDGRAEDPIAAVLHGRLPPPLEAEARQVRELLRRAAGPAGPVGHPRPTSEAARAEALTRALFAGFPDRVGRRKGGSVVFAEGGSAGLDPATPGERDGVVIVAGVERVGGQVRARAVTPLPEDWLLDGAEVRVLTSWTGRRVDVREQLVYGAIVLEDGPGQGDPDEVGALLAEHALPVAHKVFADGERAEALVHRVAWLRRVGTWAEAEGPPALDLPALVRAACRGRRSLDELAGVSLVEEAPLGPWRADVERLAPEGLPLGNRRRAPVTWPAGQDPYISSRMQDFFGLAKGPAVGPGRPLVLHLLAPNGRPVQVTTDLAGFWDRHWPGLRKELMRRYPRHYWPENPLEAEPPEPRGPRGR